MVSNAGTGGGAGGGSVVDVLAGVAVDVVVGGGVVVTGMFVVDVTSSGADVVVSGDSRGVPEHAPSIKIVPTARRSRMNRLYPHSAFSQRSYRTVHPRCHENLSPAKSAMIPGRYAGMPERPKGADCKSAGYRLRRFESFSRHNAALYYHVAT